MSKSFEANLFREVKFLGVRPTYAQLQIERAHRNTDQILMKALADANYLDRESFNVLNNLTATNLAECVKRLRRAGVAGTTDDLYDDLAHQWAETFAHYWPDDDAEVTRIADRWSRTPRSLQVPE